MSKRLKRIDVHPSFLEKILTGIDIVSVGLPRDVKILRIDYDSLHGIYVMLLESETFEEIVPLTAIPHYNDLILKRVEKKEENKNCLEL